MTTSAGPGRAWTFGDDVDTDAIVPSQYMRLDPDEYARHAMEPIDPTFADTVEPGDVVVAGTNFGIGSSREQAVVALQHLGVDAVVAESFARIFYRNAVNSGLPAVTCSRRVVDSIEAGDRVELDLEAGTIENHSRGRVDDVDPIGEPIRSILEAGGAVEYHRSR